MKRLISICSIVLFVACSSSSWKSKDNCTPPPADMSAWWPYDSGSNTISHDIALYDNAGTASGGVTQSASGKVDGAACFDGSSGEIVVPNHPEIDFAGDCVLDFADAFTIDFWIKTDKRDGTYAILDKRLSGTNSLQGWSVYLHNGQPGFQMATGGGNQICGSAGSACTNFTALASPTIADGNWHFVAVEVSARCRSARGFIYVDGAVVLNFTPRVGSISSTAPLHIFRRDPSLGSGYLGGCLDELEIFRHGLSVPQLDAIWNAGAAGKCKPKK